MRDFDRSYSVRWRSPVGRNHAGKATVCQNVDEVAEGCAAPCRHRGLNTRTAQHDRRYKSVRRSSICIDTIMTTVPMETTVERRNAIQTKTMAAVPTEAVTLPYVEVAISEATEAAAVCCHEAATSVNADATQVAAAIAWLTGLEGNGFTSRVEPASSVSSCQPGKVMKPMAPRLFSANDTILTSRQ